MLESIISLIPYIGKTWIFSDEKPIVSVSEKRGQNIGVSIAVNQQGRMYFKLTKKREIYYKSIY